MPTTTCPVCGQRLLDKQAQARVHRNLDRLLAKEKAAFERRTKEVERQAQRDLRDQLRRERAGQLERHRAEVADAKAQVIAAERRRHHIERERMDRSVATMQKENENLRRQLERLNSGERGELGEAEVFEALRRAFPGDTITRLDKRRGSADVRHEVRERGKLCGLIIYECKNVKQWSRAFVDQARSARTTYGTPHVLLVTNAFPKGKKHLAIEREVPIVHPAIVPHVARFLREGIVALDRASGSPAERQRRADRLLSYIQSSDFQEEMRTIAEAVEDLRALQAAERQQHIKTWERQKASHEAIESGGSKIQSQVSIIADGVNAASGHLTRVAS